MPKPTDVIMLKNLKNLLQTFNNELEAFSKAQLACLTRCKRVNVPPQFWEMLKMVNHCNILNVIGHSRGYRLIKTFLHHRLCVCLVWTAPNWMTTVHCLGQLTGRMPLCLSRSHSALRCRAMQHSSSHLSMGLYDLGLQTGFPTFPF